MHFYNIYNIILLCLWYLSLVITTACNTTHVYRNMQKYENNPMKPVIVVHASRFLEFPENKTREVRMVRYGG